MGQDERRWLERLRRRDESAFDQLVRSHQAAVYRLVVRMLGDEAEAQDVAQEVFISAFKAIDQFRGDSALSTWLHRIAVNHAKNRIKYLMRRARDAQQPLDDGTALRALVPAGPGLGAPDEHAEGEEASRLLQRAFGVLDGEQRELLTLRDVEQLSYDEIRELTGLPIGTVKSKLHRARMALHREYEALKQARP